MAALLFSFSLMVEVINDDKLQSYAYFPWSKFQFCSLELQHDCADKIFIESAAEQGQFQTADKFTFGAYFQDTPKSSLILKHQSATEMRDVSSFS